MKAQTGFKYYDNLFMFVGVSNCNLAFMVSILANVSKKKKKIFQGESALPGFIMDKLH